MAPPFQSIRSALYFWMRGRRRNDESSSYSEQDWWPLSSNAKFRRRTPLSSPRSSGQWSSVGATDEASSGAATSSRGSSSHGSYVPLPLLLGLPQSNSVESDTDSSIELTDRGSKESLVHGGTPWQGLQNVSQNIRAPAMACIVFIGAFATAMVVKRSFGVLSGEETAAFASDLPVYLQLPSRPLQPDDSGPSVKFSHRCYNGTVKRGRFGPSKESSWLRLWLVRKGRTRRRGPGPLLPSVEYATPGRAPASSGHGRTNNDRQRMRQEIMALARSPSCWRPLMVFVFSLVIGATLALAAYGIRGSRLRRGGGMPRRGNITYEDDADERG
ncbi:hypothetical protein HPB51_009015 [Rhipicephalus microplus]|uniref:Uncharacterized protein n=1 Tax=Rhipicephalus microplus TaxID=6941 RepID=A0A9J6D5D6_RHIMP|nr:hypothetical protein HPB51_009015 [Rhipicephalus microplus]